MSQYLEVDEIDFFPPDIIPTKGLIMRASAIIDGACKRSIAVTEYKERITLTNQRGHLSYWPVKEVIAVKGIPQSSMFGNFFGTPDFTDIDPSTVDIDLSIGTIWCGTSPFGTTHSELEVTYTSGWDPIPNKVKVACGMLVGLLFSNPNTNIKSKKDFDFSIEYFGTSIVTPEISNLLSEYQMMAFR